MTPIRVIDSHTGGEPTRVVIEGGPPLNTGALSRRVERFRREFDSFRSAVVNEPRGSDTLVGALLCEPADPRCCAGVIFFNNVGYLGMCGHAMIGLAVTLARMGRVTDGTHLIETPVGVVEVALHGTNEVTVANVPSYRYAADVSVSVDGFGNVRGDIAWGGNWFFLTDNCPFPLSPANLDSLSGYTWRIRRALVRDGITGRDGGEIDHIEVFGPAETPGADSRNFVLCPGRAYDRSPCGTGTSAKMACLYADGKLAEGQTWMQESIIGSLFEGSVIVRDGLICPRIKGSAFVNAESTLLIDDRDPFRWGIRIAVETAAV